MNMMRSPDCQAQAREAAGYLATQNYEQAALLYEQLVEIYPDEKLYRWYLGLTWLLSGEEAEAQLIWMMAMEDAMPSQIEAWTADLYQVLEAAATQQAELGDGKMAWVIRQHLRELDPQNIHNLLRLLTLAIELDQFDIDALATSGITERLPQVSLNSEQAVELFSILEVALDKGVDYLAVLEFASACAAHIPDTDALISLILKKVAPVAFIQRKFALACRYGDIGLQINPNHIEVLSFLACWLPAAERFEEAIATSQRFYSLCQNPTQQLLGNAALLRSLIKAGGNWSDVTTCMERQQALLRSWLTGEIEVQDDPIRFTILTTSCNYFPYFCDNPAVYRPLQNQVAQLAQSSLQRFLTAEHGSQDQQVLFPPRPSVHRSQPLRIAYMSCFLRRHSIGWLARWLFQHHDRERFEIYAYFSKTDVDGITPFSQKWYVDHATQSACFSGDPLGIAQTIYEDEIDILVDLDSLTYSDGCTIMGLKPAPVQVSWLGWDASGVPTVDYYIGDRYVLPESAQEYYSEKIWRMPTTYLAVDGFEVGVPNIRRDQLDIPTDAVIYFSSQTGPKRNPDNIRWQLRIIRELPNSYFLIKGFASEALVMAMFEQLAEEEGVPLDRLRFLPNTLDEDTHRANLGIADVVLDTFPYNGATTTLETLWLGIPMVTLVGQQFAARNSYGFLMNAGITEGIAWTSDEYIEWGIRLGNDLALRQQIACRLKQSRQTSPLWNAKQFTRDMETAYQQMWDIYRSGT